jgi:hypothetical protein
MVSGAIAYSELQQLDPQALKQVVAILKQHPEFETRWRSQLNQVTIPARQQDLYLLMLAARWSDDIRQNPAFDHPTWHYINFPYKPANQPDVVQTPSPASENILTALEQNLTILRSTVPDSEKAIALCWVFHLVGDLHQPLHVVSLFSTQYPEGDRGGTRFYIRPAFQSRTISLHEFWDDLILSSVRFQTVRNRATRLRLNPGHQRSELSELLDPNIQNWAEQESYTLAVQQVYRNGTLAGSSDRNHGEVLPDDYATEVQPIAERQIVLAGDRLADLLSELF